MADAPLLIQVERIKRAIPVIRGEKVMLSTELAPLYGVELRALVQAVKRNRERFPPTSCFSSRRRSGTT
jgi:hypothetical protein